MRAAPRIAVVVLLGSGALVGGYLAPRDLYEEQVIVGDRIGLIDLDDAAAGPPELDVGNLLAHLTLLGSRLGGGTEEQRAALLAGYRQTGPALDAERLVQCERLSRFRLALIHARPALLQAVAGWADDGCLSPAQRLPGA